MVMHGGLLSAPSPLEPEQALVVHVRPTEIEGFHALSGIPPYALPHHEVVGPQVERVGI